MRYLLTLSLLAFAPFAFAADAESLPPKAKVVKLDVQPAKVELTSRYAYSQLLVTAKLDTGDTVDVTRVARRTLGKTVTMTPNGQVRPALDGEGEIVLALGDQSAKVPVVVATAAKPVSFVADVQPVLSKLGCNAGTCHGSAQGKNGFKLSLRGYDPIFDHRSLTDDLEGRRFNRAAPEKSLMLLKTSGAVPHAGGGLVQPGDPYYELLRQWIADGVALDLNAPRVTGIEVFPKNPTIPQIGGKQQFAVVATYADGRKRDVSAESFVESSNTEVATVDKTGLLTSVRRGEATMLVRYEGAYAASTVVVMGDRSEFAWKQQPVQNAIDELVDAKLKKVKVLASDLCTDAEFVRRVTIDLTGLPPSAADVRAFLADPKPSRAKRDALIDTLVGSDAYVDHWTNKWGDLLQVNRKFLGDEGAAALRAWIRGQVAKNTPYDQFAYNVLTASGSNIANPPAAYYKVLREPDAAMENTTQLFLAIRFNCNKCHDHPFEKWTQDQYYQLSAYFAQVSRKEDQNPNYKGKRIGGTAVEGAKPLAEVIEDAKGGDIKNERTGQPAAPKFPFPVPDYKAAMDARRVQVAKWVTAPTNPYFAKSFVNRMWSYLLGVGIIEPVDDIRAGNPPTNPELLDKLTADFVASKFDVQALVKTICKSRTYQLSITTNRWNKDDEQNFAHGLARRLPAEVLYDAIYKATGSTTHLPGLPAGARAAQLLDSNVELPGSFLELLGKPVRESACECERSNGMMLGPVLAFVSGPVVGDAVQDGGNHIAKFTLAEKDDAKVVEEIYLSILNRKPTPAETENGVKAMEAAGGDHAALLKEYAARKAAFEAYQKTLDDKQKAWEAGLREQKPTAWTTLTPVKADSFAGPNVTQLNTGAKLKIQPDGSVLASGPLENTDVYTLTADVKAQAAYTGLRLEVLSDPSLPAKGPGRAVNGNFVLNEFRVSQRPTGNEEAKAKPVKLVGPQATFEQAGFPVANAIDNNPATGWAISPQLGTDQAAIFRFQGAVAAEKGVTLTVVMDQRFGTGHTVGKFRLSLTTDKNPKLQSPVSADLAKLLDTPVGERTAEQKADLRGRYLLQDREHQRLAADAAKVPPTDARVLGAQDLTWALLNSPAFLFNR